MFGTKNSTASRRVKSLIGLHLYRYSLPHGRSSATQHQAARRSPSQNRISSGRGSFALLYHLVDSVAQCRPLARIDRHAAMMRIGLPADNHKLASGLVVNRHGDGQLVENGHALRHDGQLCDAWFHCSSSFARLALTIMSSRSVIRSLWPRSPGASAFFTRCWSAGFRTPNALSTSYTSTNTPGFISRWYLLRASISPRAHFSAALRCCSSIARRNALSLSLSSS